MKQLTLSATLIMLLTTSCQAKTGPDGIVRAGVRYLMADSLKNGFELSVYRGDYIIPVLSGTNTYTVEIPALSVSRTYPDTNAHSYIKLPKSGTYPVSIGELRGRLRVMDYQAPAYQEVSSTEAMQLISNVSPLILDVRTPGEHQAGHIPGSTLLPVQELQSRLAELSVWKDKPVFIYCASGNRSTVAAKILIDNGFEKIYNLRNGIAEWKGMNLPLE